MYVLVSNKKQFFEIGRMLLKLLDRWMMEITKMISQVQDKEKYIKLELNFIEIIAATYQGAEIYIV